MTDIKILVVDDEKTLRELLCRDLQKEGYQAVCAKDAIEGLQLIDDSFKIAVVDLRMPKMDGLEFIKDVSQNFPRIQYIILTGHGDEKDAIAAVRLNVVDYIKKGDLVIGILLQAIEKAIKVYYSQPQKVEPGENLSNWGHQAETTESIRSITSEIDSSLSDDISQTRS